jgi:hypothetical protein
MTNNKSFNRLAPIILGSGIYQSVAGYAISNKISRQAVEKQIHIGKLPAVRIGRAWIVNLSKIDCKPDIINQPTP